MTSAAPNNSRLLHPTFDFVQELLSLGETAEVLSPKTLRKEISKIGKTVWKRNG